MFRMLLLVGVLLCAAPALAEGPAIQQVVVEGLQRVEEAAVREVIQVKSGEPLDREAVDRDLHALFDLGRFRDVAAVIEERDGVRVLVYRLEERPLVRKIEFRGNEELEEAKLREISQLRTPDLLDPIKLQSAKEALRAAYVEEGYYNAEIEVAVESGERNEATLVFDISEGDKVLISEIRFEGNTVFSERELKKVMETKERWFLSWLTDRGTYREEVLANDLEIIADRYYNRGYVQVRVKQPRVTLSEDRRSLEIHIEIEEGEQFRVGEIDVRGDLLRPREELLEKVQLQSGEVFSRSQLREDVFALSDLYADQGYAYVNVSPLTKVDTEERRIDLVFEIEQGLQVRIGRIEISGNTRTRDKVIRREMQLVEGDLYSSSKLKESRRKVKNLGFFDEVNVTTAKGPDEEQINLDVEVAERPTGTFSLGFGYSSVDKFIGQGSVSQENFLGKALKLNLAGSFGGSSTTYQVGLVEPYFLDTRLTLGFDLYKTRREWNDFTKETLGGDIKAGYPLFENSRIFFVYRYEEKEISDVDEDASLIIREQEGKSTISSVFASLTRDTTDYRLDPSKGGIAELSIEYAGLGGTEKFAKTILDYRHFFPVFWDTVFSVHGQVGYIQEIGGQEIPIDERFFLGGLRTLRGFASREVGPRDAETGDFTGGDKEAFFNLEYTFPLLKDMGLKGVIFFDTGNAWGDGEEFFSEMRYSVGGGIRWFSPMGPLRLEWGYNLDPKEFEDDSQFEFSIGKFF